MDRRLYWLATGSFTMSTVGFVISSLLKAIADDIGVSVPDAGQLIMVFALAYAVGAPVLSAALGQFDRRRLLAAAMLVFVGGSTVVATSGSYGMLIAGQGVMGMAAGLFAATAQAAAVALAGPEHRARAIAVVVGGTTLAVAVGAPLGSLIGTLWGWRGTFLAIAALGLLCALVLWLRLPRALPGARLPLSVRLRAIGRPGMPSSLLVTLLYLTGAFVVIAYLAPLAQDGVGLSEYALPQIMLAFGIGAVIGNLASGWLSDRIGATRVVVLALLTSIAMCLALAAGLKLLPQAVAGPLLVGIMLPWGMIGWAFPPAQASRIVGLAPDVAHLTLSLNASALYLGIALGTAVGGRTLELTGPSDLGLVGALFPLLALAVIAATRRGQRARRGGGATEIAEAPRAP